MANRYFYVSINDGGLPDSTYTVYYSSSAYSKATASLESDDSAAGGLSYEDVTTANNGSGTLIYTPEFIDYIIIEDDSGIVCPSAYSDIGNLIYTSYNKAWRTSEQCCLTGSNNRPIWHDGSGSIPLSRNPQTHFKSGQKFSLASQLFRNENITKKFTGKPGYHSVSSVRYQTGSSYVKVDSQGRVLESGDCQFCYTYNVTNFSGVAGVSVGYEYTDCDTEATTVDTVAVDTTDQVCSLTEPILTVKKQFGSVDNLGIFCNCGEISLSYSNSTAALACDGSVTTYYADQNTFCSSTLLYTNNDCTTLASAGYYADPTTGDDVRYWDGSAFTDPCYTCGGY